MYSVRVPLPWCYIYPKHIEALSGVVGVACGWYHSAAICALRRPRTAQESAEQGGTLFVWGSAARGQLGVESGKIRGDKKSSS
ncbi:hypothetical protein T484DRAFT_1805856 [Baffinella frigidus]|nr:hypothetical protein T484DRAFT_1805856 [Cryptophyta sp. CCMP2293]